LWNRREKGGEERMVRKAGEQGAYFIRDGMGRGGN